MKSFYFRILLLLWTTFCSGNLFSQTAAVSDQEPFYNYLMNQHEYEDAISLLKKIPTPSNYSDVDNLNYMFGWAYFNKKSLDTASSYFEKVSAASSYHIKSKFYESFDYAYIKNSKKAREVINAVQSNDTSILQLKNLHQAGYALLNRDYKQFESLSSGFSYTYFPISMEEKNMSEYYSDLKKIKSKSPVVAGIMSAIIPGSGKIYAGYRMQGIAAFLQCAVFGAATAECYYKWQHPSIAQKKRSIMNEPYAARFFVIGTLFSAFYIGNIWGSALSVQIKKEEHFNEIDNAILVDLNIPLRRIFN